MKKALSIVITLVLCISMLSVFNVQAATVKITDAQGFLAIAQNPAGDYELGADIDMSEYPLSQPIAETFSGTLNGNGYTVSGISLGYSSNIALFKKMTGKISNLFIKDAKITLNSGSTSYVGIITTELSGTVEKVVIDAEISINTPGTWAGAVCSYLTRGAVVSNCEVNGSISVKSTSNSTFSRVGGIASYTPAPSDEDILAGKKYPIISKCTNNMTITAEDEKAASFYAAGIVAFPRFQTEISDCYNTGDITVKSSGASYAGGISAIAANNSGIARCENSGEIIAQFSQGGYESYAGGIVGAASGSEEGITISNCANYGDIKADTAAGGILADVYAKAIRFTFVSPTAKINAESQGRIYGKLSYSGASLANNYSEFMDEYEGFDFDKIWTIAADKPHLANAGVQTKPVAPVPVTFSDVKAKDWFYTHVQYALTHKIFSGKSAQNFAPQAKMTRAEFVQVLANLEKIDLSVKPAKSDFTDVKLSDWYATAVMWAAKNKIVSGYNGKFNPNSSMSRQDMCVMLINYINFKKIKPKAIVAETAFADDAKIGAWAKNAVYTCQKSGFVSGKGAGNFDPNGTALRSEVAALFKNFHEKYM